MFDLTSPINPPTHQIIHPNKGGGVSPDFKSLSGIEISQSVQVLLNFYWFWESPLGVGDGERMPSTHVHTHAHACMCTHTHTCIWHHREFPGIPPKGVAICMKLSCLPCMHVHMYVGHPQPPPPSAHPHPTAVGSPNHQNSISLELIKIIRFCLKILYLWTLLNYIDYSWSPWTPPSTCPIPQSQGNPNQKNYNKSWTNQDNSILFEDLWPLNPPGHI